MYWPWPSGHIDMRRVFQTAAANGSDTEERKTMTFLNNFLKDEQGQDLIEYTLLMAFVALASAALFLGAGGSIKGIWQTTNTQLSQANSSAS
jgi:Flp pilus assembly pilin Flp